MNISLKGIEQILIEYASSDPQVRLVRYADEWLGDTKRADEYPVILYDFVQSEVNSNKMGQVITTYSLLIACMDRITKDRDNISDVLSRTNTILTYLALKFKADSTLRDMDVRFIEPNIVVQQAKIKSDNDIKGCMVTMKFTIPNAVSSCDLPYLPISSTSNVYTPDSTSSVLCAEIQNCGVIQNIQDDIALLFQLTGGTGSSFACSALTTCPEYVAVSGLTYQNSFDIDAHDVSLSSLSAQTASNTDGLAAHSISLSVLSAATDSNTNNIIAHSASLAVLSGQTAAHAVTLGVLSSTTLSLSAITTAHNISLTQLSAATAALGTVSGQTFVQNGNQIVTGGTALLPTVNLVPSPSVTNLIASGVIYGDILSGNTIYSGGTELSVALQNKFNSVYAPFTVQNQWVQAGVNVYTGGTPNAPIVGVIGSPSFTAVTASNFISGSTNLNSVFAPISVQSTFVQEGLNISTGGTPTRPIINTRGTVTFTGLTVQTGGIVSRTSNDFQNASNSVTNTSWAASDTQPMSFNGGRMLFDRSLLHINNKASFSCETSDGTTYFIVNRLGEFGSGIKVTGAGEVSTNFSAGTYYSGSTLLHTALKNIFDGLYAQITVQNQWLQNGQNTTTGGTQNLPKVNLVSSPSVNNLIASGVSYGATVSGATIYEGSSLLSSKYAPKDLTVTLNSGTYILALTDDSRMVDLSGASAQNLVVPRNAAVALPIGAQVMVVQTGAGQVTFSADTGVSLLSYNSQLKIAGQYGAASLVKKDTNTWVIVGNLSA